MQSYSYQTMQQQQKQQYKQELGLRKMLYKYQHENEQLKNQIKALTQRLESIMNKNTTSRSAGGQREEESANAKNKMEEMHAKYLNEQMSYYFKRIEQVNSQIKGYKEAIDVTKEIQFTHLTNTLKDKVAKLEVLKNKVEKFRMEEAEAQNSQQKVTPIVTINNNTNVNNYEELEAKYTNQLAETKKKIRQLQKIRNNNLKMEINRHATMVNLQAKTRKIANNELQTIQVEQALTGPVKKGLWGLDLTQQNYRKILEDLEQLKKQKNVLLQSIKIENAGLRDRLMKLKNQYIDLSSNANINNSVNLSVNKLKESSLLTPKKDKKETIHLPDLPVPLGNSAYQRKNDKNFVPKKIKLLEWNPNKGKKGPPSFSWNDQSSKSPITGINIWLDKQLIGVQFIHTLGQTIQHIHTEGGSEPKKLVPIQYRLNSNDYLQNIILVIGKPTAGKLEVPAGGIVGIQLHSKNGRKDGFGMKVGTQGTDKYDFGIVGPEKPIYSFGSFVINSTTHLSTISSIGFAVI